VVGSGANAVAYFGENGVTGADDGGHEFAINASTCALKWQFSGFGSPPGSATLSGSWSPPAYATDVNGRQLIVFGGSSPDCAVYAVDADTGQLVWRFQTQIFAQDNDVGAGPTISDPGVNGFADGVVYVSGKDRVVYALNLRTGAKLWEFSIRADSPSVGGATRSTAALLSKRLYVGYGAGVYALNAVTGQKVWKTEDFGVTTQEVISSPAITGDSASGRVLFVGDTDGQGKFRAFTLDGALKWTYTTGAFIYGSPAIADGHVYTTSSSGFLYAFAPGGSIGPKPDTTISVPADGSTLPNTGSVSVTGTATDNVAVSKVLVAIKNKNSGAWWDAGQQKWTKTYQETAASLANPGAASTGWSLSFPVPATGAPFVIEASAVDNGGQHDPTTDRHQVLVASTGNPPETTISAPVFRQVFHPPVDNDPDHFGLFDVPFYITATGTATDSGGAHPGIQKVLVTVRNIEHAEYNCGPATGALPEGCWQPTLITEQATLTNPGATSTNWTFQFPIYDHPHKYRIVAWAVDNDGEVDTTRASVDRICLRNPSDDTCA
jgi:outer membrane protein assembly factor BamB